jgi:Tol biopolymer transport system component
MTNERAFLILGGVVVAFAVGASAAAAPPSDVRSRSLILFWSDQPGGPALYSIRPDGSHRRWIFRIHRGCKRPSLSPDRRWIVFDGPLPGYQERWRQQFDVQVIRRDGTGRRTLTSSDDREIQAQWSPDGSRISYSRLREADEDDWRLTWIWTMRPDGSDQQPLVNGNSAHWSPDGKQLVFSAPSAGSDGDLFVVNADGTGLRHLMATPTIEWPGDWSPDGRKILFTRSFSDTSSDLYVMNVDGTGVRRLTHARGIEADGSWSPDGSRIVYASNRFGWSHLFVMRADGTRRRELTNSRANDFSPSWR